MGRGRGKGGRANGKQKKKNYLTPEGKIDLRPKEGKARTDAYSYRSKKLEQKCFELKSLTGAYISFSCSAPWGGAARAFTYHAKEAREAAQQAAAASASKAANKAASAAKSAAAAFETVAASVAEEATAVHPPSEQAGYSGAGARSESGSGSDEAAENLITSPQRTPKKRFARKTHNAKRIGLKNHEKNFQRKRREKWQKWTQMCVESAGLQLTHHWI